MDIFLCLSFPCSYLLGKGLALLYHCAFVTFPYGVLGQAWFLIVSIPDLSSYFARNHD